jgi:hypothetical protein
LGAGVSVVRKINGDLKDQHRGAASYERAASRRSFRLVWLR